VVFTDVVSEGSTFGDLFAVLRAWSDQEHAQWDVIRRKLRFTGVTFRLKTSPNAFRWQQHAPWTTQFAGQFDRQRVARRGHLVLSR
jgi:hypothetical protein